MADRRFTTPSPASLRAHLNQARGRRLENYFVRKFRAAGFNCRRHDERDGFGRGVDLVFLDANKRRLPVVAQVKYTTLPLLRTAKALSEARAGDPSAHLWLLCAYIHPPGTKRGTYLFAYTLPCWTADHIVTVDWPHLCRLIRTPLN